MSITKVVIQTIRCDWAAGTVDACQNAFEETDVNAQDARYEAAAEGWYFRNGKDWCPGAHAEAAQPVEPLPRRRRVPRFDPDLVDRVDPS